MNIISLFSKKSFSLCFSLLCGLAYFGIASAFVLNNTDNGSLLLLFFFPAIICGGALFVFKAIKSYLDAEATKPLHFMLWGHIVVFLFSIAVVIEAILF